MSTTESHSPTIVSAQELAASRRDHRRDAHASRPSRPRRAPGARRQRVPRRLREAGIDVEGRCGSGQLEIETWDRTHVRAGYFDQHAMIGLVESVLVRARTDGYPLTRLVANMEWALEDLPGVHDLVEYESRFNRMIASYDDAVICTYDATRFGGDLIVDVLRTHPLVILGGRLQENPFYVPPDQLLAELQLRGRAAGPAYAARG